MNFDSFSHGQIQSKLWLCEKLEPYIPPNANITILASWYNVLGLMLMLRNPSKYKSIKGVDIDPTAINIANKICDAWTLQPKIIENVLGDANLEYIQADVVINCSPEHIEGFDWFHRIESGKLTCIQTSNQTTAIEPWLIKNPCQSLEQFSLMYPMSATYFCGSIRIQYTSWGYDRFMIIGMK